VLRPDGKKEKVDVRTLPFIRFQGNEAHTNNTVGFNLGEGVGDVGPDAKHPFVIRDLKIWYEGYYAFRPMAPSVLVEGLHIRKGAYGIYHPSYARHVYRNLKFTEISLPFAPGYNGASIQKGAFTVDGLTFEYTYGRGPWIYLSENDPSGKAEGHFRNVKVLQTKATGGTLTGLFDYRETYEGFEQTWTGVPLYFHDHFGKGRTAKVLSVKSKDVKENKDSFREVSGLTSKGTRAAEVKGVAFPKLLDPIDDLPPATVITHVRREGDKLLVSGVTADDGVVKRVLVNGKEAKATADNFAQWTIELPAADKLSAFAEDAAGNKEMRPHVVAAPSR
jgi:hypothetical protein